MNGSPRVSVHAPDFLERQIEKSIGGGSGLRPRLPSLFEPTQEKGINLSTFVRDPESRIAVEAEIADNRPQTRSVLENLPHHDVQDRGSTTISTSTMDKPMPSVTEKFAIHTHTSISDMSAPMPLLASSLGATHRVPEWQSDRKAFVAPQSRDINESHQAVVDDVRPQETLIPSSMRVIAALRPESSDFNPSGLLDSHSPVVAEDNLRGNDAKEMNQPLLNTAYADRDQQEPGKLHERKRDLAKANEANKEAPATVLAQRIVIAPLTAPHRPAHASLRIEPVPADPTPVINVTIGRIEIRAHTGPASPTQTKENRGPKSMNLDEYLKQRGGKR